MKVNEETLNQAIRSGDTGAIVRLFGWYSNEVELKDELIEKYLSEIDLLRSTYNSLEAERELLRRMCGKLNDFARALGKLAEYEKMAKDVGIHPETLAPERNTSENTVAGNRFAR